MKVVRWKAPDLFDMSWLLDDEVSDDDAELGSADDPPCLMIPAKGGVIMAVFVQTVQTPPFSYKNFLNVFQTMNRNTSSGLRNTTVVVLLYYMYMATSHQW